MAKTQRRSPPTPPPSISSPSPRKRQRAATFASKKTTSKRRTPRSSTRRHLRLSSSQTPSPNPVDLLLRNARSLANGVNHNDDNVNNHTDKSPERRDLLSALARADNHFSQDLSDEAAADSMSDSDDVDIHPPARMRTPKAVRFATGVRHDRLNHDEMQQVASFKLSTKKSPSNNASTRQKHIQNLRSRLEKSRSTTTPVPVPVPGSEKRLGDLDDDQHTKNALRTHKHDIEALKKDDPLFHQFLEENDATLLDVDDLIFDADDDVDHASDSDQQQQQSRRKGPASRASRTKRHGPSARKSTMSHVEHVERTKRDDLSDSDSDDGVIKDHDPNPSSRHEGSPIHHEREEPASLKAKSGSSLEPVSNDVHNSNSNSDHSDDVDSSDDDDEEPTDEKIASKQQASDQIEGDSQSEHSGAEDDAKAVASRLIVERANENDTTNADFERSSDSDDSIDNDVSPRTKKTRDEFKRPHASSNSHGEESGGSDAMNGEDAADGDDEDSSADEDDSVDAMDVSDRDAEESSVEEGFKPHGPVAPLSTKSVSVDNDSDSNVEPIESDEIQKKSPKSGRLKKGVVFVDSDDSSEGDVVVVGHNAKEDDAVNVDEDSSVDEVDDVEDSQKKEVKSKSTPRKDTSADTPSRRVSSGASELKATPSKKVVMKRKQKNTPLKQPTLEPNGSHPEASDGSESSSEEEHEEDNNLKQVASPPKNAEIPDAKAPDVIDEEWDGEEEDDASYESFSEESSDGDDDGKDEVTEPLSPSNKVAENVKDNEPEEPHDESDSDTESPPVGNGEKSPDKAARAPDATGTGYSDEESEDEGMAEKEAAAEAGIEVDGSSGSEADDEPEGSDQSDSENTADDAEAEENSSDDGEDEEDGGNDNDEIDSELQEDTSDGVSLVDLKYLRRVKELLSSNRAGAKVCNDLLKVFRAGRDLLPKSKKTASKQDKSRGNGRRNDMEGVENDDVAEADDEDYGGNDGFTAHKVKFTSSKAYQQAMNLCMIGLQDAFDRMLDKPSGKGKKNLDTAIAKWNPKDSPRWIKLQGSFQQFAGNMIVLAENVADAPTLRFLLMRLERIAVYTVEDEKLLKKLVRLGVRVWASDMQHVSEETRLRAYLLLSRVGQVGGNAETVLRGCVNAYCKKIGAACNAKTLPLIHFAGACVVELFGIDMGASYTTLFSYLREMAVDLRAVLVSKDGKEEVERIHNWTFVNQVRLFGKVLGRYGGKEELEALIYPYVQIAIGVMRAQATPRTMPLRLHVASYLTELMKETGTFIPVMPHVMGMLRCSELKKRGAVVGLKKLEWRGLLRVGEDAVKSKVFLDGVVNGVVLETCRYFGTIARHVAFPEVAYVTEGILRKSAKEMGTVEWKERLLSVAGKLRETSAKVVKARRGAGLAPKDVVGEEGMRMVASGLGKGKLGIERLFEVEKGRAEQEGMLKDEDDAEEAAGGRTGMKKKKKRKSADGGEGKVKKARVEIPVLRDGDADMKDEVEALNLDSDGGSDE